MSDSTTDDVVDHLGELATEAPPELLDRVVARWTRETGPFADLYVAFTDMGISFARTAWAVGDRDERFLEAYRERFGRPLRPAERSPAGLRAALRSGRADGLRFDLSGLTPFEREVLHATVAIPRGETRPYAWVAREIGRPRAVRAVGSALGRNPVPVLIPCHRVTRSDGRPGNYFYGPAAKVALLRAEDVDLDGVQELADAGIFFVGSETTTIVCLPTCRHARRIDPAHRRGFRDMGEAAREGYRPCRDCRPAALTA
ncbi:MAG: methylated-DNA--[protein]-cysteine S-methyltransferase [Actinomycetota bacterium]|nr:methylated-DNA--[protein]-cysteine S-methyltransferase [Actinomycetota bacterium]